MTSFRRTPGFLDTVLILLAVAVAVTLIWRG